MSAIMGSDGDHFPDSSMQKDQEQEEMLALARNGQSREVDAGNRNSLIVLQTAHSELPHHGPLSSSRLRFLPVVMVVFLLVALIISYTIAVSLGHVHWNFPYISHTATGVPERGIFSQMVNIGAVMLAANIYVRYLQMEICLRHIIAPRADKWINRAAAISGFISAFGLSMVANFQTLEMRSAHYTGAALAFIPGTVYCCMQTILSLRNTKRTTIIYIQIIISIVLTICLIIFIVSKATYKIKENRGHGTKHDTLRDVYLVSTLSEWLTAIFMITFGLTFYKDFSNISLKLPSVEMRNTDMTDQIYRSRRRQNGTTLV